MTITNNKGLYSAEAQADFAEAAAAETVAEGAESLALEGITPAVNGDFSYSATAEDLGTAGALDLEPGFIYSGPPGNHVRVKFTGLDLSAGTIAPEAADTVAAVLYKNSEIVDYADEGFVAELDTATHEMNIDTVVGPLKTGDVLRVGLKGGGEETVDVDVALGGTLNIV